MKRSTLLLGVVICALARQACGQGATPPTIASISSSQTVTEGQTVSFTASVNGTVPFTYQWQKAGANIPGATNGSLTFTAVRVSDAGSYTLVVTNSAGSATGGPILLAVTAASAPSINFSPSNVTIFVGDTLSFSVSVNGTSPFTYEWKRDGVTVATTTSSSYSKPNAQAADAGSYTVTISNIAGATTSGAFTVTVSPPTAPTITAITTNRTYVTGDFLSLSVNVSGASPFSYQWNKDGTPISGAVGSSYSRSSVTTADAGSYTVTVTNSAGSVTSSAVIVTVTPGPAATAPSISLSSSTSTVNVGDGFSLGPFVSGSSPIAYQWRKDGQPIAGATNSSFSTSPVVVGDVGAYSLVATNSAGSTTSATAPLAIRLPQLPVITVHPASQTLNPGDSQSLSVSAFGQGLTYQWRKNGVVQPNTNSSSYFVSSQTTPGTDSYTVVVSNTKGSVISEPAVITFLPVAGPVITTQPAGVNLRQGETLSLSAGVSSTVAVTFQWQKDGVAIAGATSANYSKSSVASSDTGAYTVVITNSAGSVTSAPANVVVSPAVSPVILRHPGSVALLPGEFSSALSVDVRSTTSVTYQWRKDGAPVAGATFSNLSINSAQPASAGTYTVVVTGASGSVTSNPAVVTVDTSRPLVSSTSGGVAANAGDFVTLQVGIGVSSGVSVVWRKDGAVIAGATTSSYSLSSITPANAGTYVATVSTATTGTSADSRPIPLELLDLGIAPRVLRQPVAVTSTAGGFVNFSVSVEGERPFTYQWRKDGSPIVGATASSYSFPSAVTTTDAGSYSVVITNRNGNVTSDSVPLVVSAADAAGAPVFRSQASSRVVFSDASNSTTLFVNLMVSSGVTYQWRKDGTLLSGATTSTLNITATASSSGRYTVTATNGAGSTTSGEMRVTVTPTPSAPQFTTNPSNQNVLPGASVTFNAVATGASPVSYQWRKNGAELRGATDTSLTLTNVQAADAGLYTVIATTSEGVASSTGATLSLATPAAGRPVITAEPRSAVMLPGGAVTLTAGVASNPAATYQWFVGSRAIAGATNTSLTITGAPDPGGTYYLVATNSLGSTSTQLVTVRLGAAITFAPATSRAAAAGTAVSLSVAVQSTAALTYQWRRDGVPVAGATNATLDLARVRPADGGAYTLVATSVDGSVESPAIVLTVANSPFAGAYFGSITSGDSMALFVGADGTGTFLSVIAARNQAIIARDFVVQSDGTFSATVAAEARPAAFVYTGTVSGTIAGATATGNLPAAGMTFSAGQRAATGVATAAAGAYQGVPVAAAVGETYLIAAADGTLQLVAVDADGARGTRGTVGANGAFTVTQPQYTYTGNVGLNGASLTGTYQPAGGAVVTLAAPALSGGLERLANVSTRSLAGSGARTLIAGFAINGTAPKDVLVRAAGPALAAFGLDGTLANPRLRLFKGSTQLFENDDWSVGLSTGTVTVAAARLGAFPFAVGSADAALLVRLDPGSYSAQVTSDSATGGVALVEVYDASTATGEAQRLINLSTRADVGTGGDILIVGVVVSGTAPKKLLIRGIGPALAGFGVTGALAAPRLQLYRGTQLLRESTGWSAGADAPLIVTAAGQVAAFPLTPGSKDCALLLYLAPGAYTAQVSGVGGTTGVALVEVYEVP